MKENQGGAESPLKELLKLRLKKESQVVEIRFLFGSTHIC